MRKFTPEECIEWATPESWRFLGHANSPEQLEAITEFVTHERRAWLLEATRSELAKRSGVQMPSTEVVLPECPRFEDLPYQHSLTYAQHKTIVDDPESFKGHPFGYKSKFRIFEYKKNWRTLAEYQAVLAGHSITAAKYHDGFYKNEAVFNKAYVAANNLYQRDYPVRFNMNGVRYIGAAALNLDSVAAWIDHGHGYHFDIIGCNGIFWPQMLKEKQRYDEINGLETFADVCEEIMEGVYHAPYLPDQLTESGEYIGLDQVRRALHESDGDGQDTPLLGVFSQMLEYGGEDKRIGHKWAQIFRLPPQLSESGVFFFHRSALPSIYERMLADTNSHKARTWDKMARIMEVLFEDEYEKQWYEDVVFHT